VVVDERYDTQYSLVNNLRRIIYIRKVKYKVIRALVVIISALTFYLVAGYCSPYIIELFG